MPSRRRPATSVVVFRWPCGTASAGVHPGRSALGWAQLSVVEWIARSKVRLGNALEYGWLETKTHVTPSGRTIVLVRIPEGDQP